MTRLVKYASGNKWIADISIMGLRKKKLLPDDSITSKLAAEQFEQDVRDRFSEYDGPLTFQFCATEYLEWKNTTITGRTFQKIRAEINRFNDFLPDNLDVDKVNPPKVRKYLITQSGRSGQARNKIIEHLNAMWVWCQKQITCFPDIESPFKKTGEGTDKKQYAEDKPGRYIPPISHIVRMMEGLTGQDRFIVRLIFQTAARPIEVFRLKMPDIDLDGRKIRFWSKKTADHGMQHRWVPMDKESLSIITAWLIERTNIKPAKDFSKTVFISGNPTNYGKGHNSRAYSIKKTCLKVGVPPFGLYALRHVRARIWYAIDRVSPNDLQKRLGHSSLRTTAKYLKDFGLDINRDLDGYELILPDNFAGQQPISQ